MLIFTKIKKIGKEDSCVGLGDSGYAGKGEGRK
jgi:hypothetical protein